MPRAITVASQKGGVGKTTTVVNLAASLCLSGRKVLLVDLDSQANATSGVGVERPVTSGIDANYLSALLRRKPLAPFVQETRINNLWVLPASPELVDLNIIQELIATSALRLRGELAQVAANFHYILIDCPPSLLGPPTIALLLSDSVIVPVQCEYYAMEGLSQILPIIQNLKETVNRGLAVEGLLLTMFSPDLELSHEVVQEITEYFRDQTFRTIVPRDVTLAEAASHGQPALQYAPSSRGAWSYIELAREVIEHG